MADWRTIDDEHPELQRVKRRGDRVLIAWRDKANAWQQRAAYWDGEFSNDIDDDGNDHFTGAWTDGAVQSFGYEEVFEYKPTHWQPLPAPPDV